MTEEERRQIEEKVAQARERIAEAAAAAGRRPEDITLVAATKMNDADAVRQAIAAGVDCCGENRVQELVRKRSEDAYRGAPVHFIGHLQTNKVRQVVGSVDLIQSVGSVKLLSAIDAEEKKQGIIQDILLEVNVAGEAAKTGFSPEEVLPLLDQIGNFSNICMKGLMSIPPIPANPGDNLYFFQKISLLSVDIMKKKYDNVMVDCLSMGMSADFADAIRSGATMIRIGTAIFGPRNYA